MTHLGHNEASIFSLDHRLFVVQFADRHFDRDYEPAVSTNGARLRSYRQQNKLLEAMSDIEASEVNNSSTDTRVPIPIREYMKQ